MNWEQWHTENRGQHTAVYVEERQYTGMAYNAIHLFYGRETHVRDAALSARPDSTQIGSDENGWLRLRQPITPRYAEPTFVGSTLDPSWDVAFIHNAAYTYDRERAQPLPSEWNGIHAWPIRTGNLWLCPWVGIGIEQNLRVIHPESANIMAVSWRELDEFVTQQDHGMKRDWNVFVPKHAPLPIGYLFNPDLHIGSQFRQDPDTCEYIFDPSFQVIIQGRVTIERWKTR